MKKAINDLMTTIGAIARPTPGEPSPEIITETYEKDDCFCRVEVVIYKKGKKGDSK